MISVGLPHGGNIVRQLRSWSQPQPPCTKLQKEVEIRGALSTYQEEHYCERCFPGPPYGACKIASPCSSKNWVCFIIPSFPNTFSPLTQSLFPLLRGWLLPPAKFIRPGLSWWGKMLFANLGGSQYLGFRGCYLQPRDLREVRKRAFLFHFLFQCEVSCWCTWIAGSGKMPVAKQRWMKL